MNQTNHPFRFLVPNNFYIQNFHATIMVATVALHSGINCSSFIQYEIPFHTIIFLAIKYFKFCKNELSSKNIISKHEAKVLIKYLITRFCTYSLRTNIILLRKLFHDIQQSYKNVYYIVKKPKKHSINIS